MADTEGYVDQSVAGLAEPQPMYKMLRESTPVFRPGPEGPVVLSRLADIEMALKRTDVFSSNMDAVDLGNVRPLIPSADRPARAREVPPHPRSALHAARDGRVGNRPSARLVNQMIDGFADRGECDFHDEFAVPLPCTVFLQLLGPPAGRPRQIPGLEGRRDPARRAPRASRNTARRRHLPRSRSMSTSSAPSRTTSPTRATTYCPR